MNDMNNKTAIQSAQLRLLFSASNVSMITSTLLAAILAYVQLEVIAFSVVLCWFSLVVLVALSRAALVIAFQHAQVNQITATDVWLFRFRVGVLALGVVWGSAGFLMFPTNDPQHQMFLIFMLAGLSAGGVAAFSADLVCAIVFSITSLLPLTIHIFTTGGSLSVAMGFSVLLYLGFMMISMRQINQNLTENIVLHLEAVAREEKVRKSEERYHILLNHSPFAIFHYDTNLVITYCNKCFAELLHKSIDSIVGSDMNTFHDQSILPASRDALSGDLGLYEGEYFATADQPGTWLDMTCAPSRDETGSIMGGIAIVRDITERKQAEQVLHQLKAMIDISMDGFWIVDLMGNLLQVNEAYSEMSGYSIDELEKMHISQLEALEESEQVKAHIEKVATQGYDLFETRHRHKDGHIIDVEISVAFLPEFQHFCVFCRDITERKVMENERIANETKFRSIIEVSPVPMALLNDDFVNLTFLNQAFVKTFGYNRDDIPTLADWWPKAYPDPAYQNWVKASWQMAMEKAKQEHTDIPPLEVVIHCKNNNIKTVLISAAEIHNFADTYLVILYDITQLKQIEAKLNAIFNASVEGIITIDLSGIITSVNVAVETIFGYTPEELIGCRISKFIPSSPKKLSDRSLPDAVQVVGQIQEIEGIHKNGFMVPLDLSVAEYSIENAHYFTYIVRDVSLRKQRERKDKEHLSQLAHVTRLGLMGEMASGIAHEVNQPLSAISSYTQVSINLINSENPDLVLLSEILYKTQQQALRAGRIIHRMKEFAKSHSKHRSTADINMLIDEAVNLCFAEITHHCIKLTLKLESNLPPVCVDRIQIEQVITNLIRNSIEALQHQFANQHRQLSIQSTLAFNNAIEVSLKDNGPGIDEEQQQKIFMPFYTTKVEGIGMGLSISKSIIEAHEGNLQFKSIPGQGSNFYFTLPIQRIPGQC